MDSSHLIPVQAVVCMGISIGVILALPLIFIIVSWIRKKTSVSAAFLGIVSFLAGFATYGIIWCIFVVVRTGGFVTTNLQFSDYIVYAVVAGIAAAFWNYFIRKLHYKKHKKPWDSLCFYSAFALAGGIRSAIPIIENMRLAVLYNGMGLKYKQEALQKTIEYLGDDREGKLALERIYQVSMKAVTKGGSYFLINGLEFLLLMACFLSMGVLLERTLKEGKMFCSSFLLLVVFQIGTELPSLLAKGNKVAAESREVILAVTAALAVLCVFIGNYRKKEELAHGNPGNAAKDTAD